MRSATATVELPGDPSVRGLHYRVDLDGVHINSGIPNRTFALAAQAIGGHAWEGAGRLWYRALIGGLAADAEFSDFAEATLAAAEADGATVERAVREAWTAVGVVEDAREREPRRTA